MRIRGCAEVLSDAEVQAIHDATLTVLEQVGAEVECPELLGMLGDHGVEVDLAAKRARLKRPWMEAFLDASSDDYDERPGLQSSCLLPDGQRAAYSNGVECTAGAYPQMYLDVDGDLREHTMETVAVMTRLGDALPNIDRMGVMGVPSDMPGKLQPMWMRMNAWRYAAQTRCGCGEVHHPELIPYIIEMCELWADAKGLDPHVVTFAETEMVSPLRLRRNEATIVHEFWKRGYLAGIGSMPAAGASAPATLAGTLVVALAETLFVNAVYRILFGLKKLWLQINASILDMRRGMMPLGRPERGLLSLAMGQMARHYRAGVWTSGIYNDAKAPSPESGYQAAAVMVPAIMAGSLAAETFGLLSSGEIGSPVQLVLDDEFAGMLKRLVRGMVVDDETLDVADIVRLGPGGFFTDTDHTAKHFRSEYWEPTLFSQEALNAWLSTPDRTHALERAQEKARHLMATHQPDNMDDDTRRRLEAIIDRAAKELDMSS